MTFIRVSSLHFQRAFGGASAVSKLKLHNEIGIQSIKEVDRFLGHSLPPFAKILFKLLSLIVDLNF